MKKFLRKWWQKMIVMDDPSEPEVEDACAMMVKSPLPPTRLVCGYLFSPDLQWVLLIKKARPAWMVGALAGVGGHVEPLESYEEAIRREVREEAGSNYDVSEWVYLDRVVRFADQASSHPFEIVLFFCAVLPDGTPIRPSGRPIADIVQGSEGEHVAWYRVTQLHRHFRVSDAQWLVHKGIERIATGEFFSKTRVRGL